MWFVGLPLLLLPGAYGCQWTQPEAVQSSLIIATNTLPGRRPRENQPPPPQQTWCKASAPQSLRELQSRTQASLAGHALMHTCMPNPSISIQRPLSEAVARPSPSTSTKISLVMNFSKFTEVCAKTSEFYFT